MIQRCDMIQLFTIIRMTNRTPYGVGDDDDYEDTKIHTTIEHDSSVTGGSCREVTLSSIQFPYLC